MAHNPNMRDLLMIAESYTQNLMEEFAIEPTPARGIMSDTPVDDPFRDTEPALPLELTALTDVPGLYMKKGDKLYVEPTTNHGEVYSEENGMTYDWDWISSFSERGMLSVNPVEGEKDPVEVPFVEDAGEQQECAWWALCTNDATTTEPHPVLGEVPICDRCVDKLRKIEGLDEEELEEPGPECTYCDDEEPLDGFPCLNCGSKQFVGEAGDPDDTDWDAHWAREDGDDERADDLEADAEWARMDDELNEAATRKDFRMVADLISKIEDPALRQSSAEDHARMFALQNPRFNATLFYAAAGAEEPLDEDINAGADAGGELLYPPTVYDGEGNEHPYSIYYDTMKNYSVGDTVTSSAAAPGYGKISHRITRMDDTGVYGVETENTIQELEPWMVEDENDARGKMCPVCTGGRREGYGRDCPNCNGEGYVTEAGKPYATMKDGPDKYLFRKDGRQKLVGSANNEVDTDEETCNDCLGVGTDEMFNTCYSCGGSGIVAKQELEDLCAWCHGDHEEYGCLEMPWGDADDFEVDDEGYVYFYDPKGTRKETPEWKMLELEESRFQYEVDGYGYEEEEDWPFDNDEPSKKWHYMTTPSGERVTLDHSPYQTMDKNEFAAHVAKHRGIKEMTMDKEIREMQIAAGIVVEEEKCEQCADCKCDPCECEEAVEEGKLPDALKQHQFGKKDDDKEEVDEESCDEDADIKEMQIAAGIIVAEDCSEEDEENDDGECSPFTHADDNVKMVREEELDEGGDIVKALMKMGKQKLWIEYNRAMEDDGAPTKHLIAMKQALSNLGVDIVDEDMLLAPPGDVGPGVDEDDFDRVEPELDRQTDFNAPPRDDGDDSYDMNEEPNDNERIIDVGDDEDYEKYDFDDEFEQMLGGSSDMPGAEYNGMYEMNELRRLAGLEQLEEKDVVDGQDVADGEDEEVEVDEAIAAGPQIASDEIVAYEVGDEKAYYVMADLLGAELDFGPQDEVLIPKARQDEIEHELDMQGFVQGRDFAVAGQMFDDLQNGYDDRAFTKGSDYFPGGATSSPSNELGPAGAKQGDNPMRTSMISVDKEDEIYESMKLSYRRHRRA